MIGAFHNGRAADDSRGIAFRRQAGEVYTNAAVPDEVDRLYKKAIELGATCEGPAGPRGDTFYGGYFRDLDGNKLNFFCMG